VPAALGRSTDDLSRHGERQSAGAEIVDIAGVVAENVGDAALGDGDSRARSLRASLDVEYRALPRTPRPRRLEDDGCPDFPVAVGLLNATVLAWLPWPTDWSTR
jgi:hypothetical protein